ncbi:MAG: diacylglycerol kinase family protein [Flavobacteriaceae bacterium]|nr:diacylglycerol kinase family protein [Flavobacteriaceae bacterium]
MKKKKIHFIINSRSKNAITQLTEQLQKSSHWTNEFDYFLWETQYKDHALELAQKAIEDRTSGIVACGGDGTINEITGFLVETKTPLGIIPLGSGNSIARHLKIPLNIEEALKVIENQNVINVNAGSVNDFIFLSNMGVSFDSNFINSYQSIPSRGFYAYLKALFLALYEYKTQKFSLYYQGIKREVSPFLLMVVNTNQFGYDFSISRESIINDGKLELILYKKKSVWALFNLFLASRFGLKLSEKLLEIVPITEVKIKNVSNNFLIQLDGEINPISAEELSIKIHPRGVNIWVPQ